MAVPTILYADSNIPEALQNDRNIIRTYIMRMRLISRCVILFGESEVRMPIAHHVENTRLGMSCLMKTPTQNHAVAFLQVLDKKQHSLSLPAT